MARLARKAFEKRGRILHGPQNTAVRLVLIGLVAGLFSALLGVGGGIVVVPLLILLAYYDERRRPPAFAHRQPEGRRQWSGFRPRRAR